MDNNNLPMAGLTLGSLFDGIGGFPYAASFFGIKPLWASEIMPQAVSVTQRHLPVMAHVGDITQLDGTKLPPVDIITFGSPCQDLSMAGRRAGINGERSGLFYEAIRIINEMREATNGKYPRYALWENVPGALSSNRGRDYQAVLEAFTKTEIPMPDSGKWANAGMVRSDGVDLAWVVYNAQYFGVPQRRRRIFLICDFGGASAGEILFVPKSLSGYFAARRKAGQDLTGNVTGSSDGASISAGVSIAASENDTAATIFAGYGNHWNGNAGAYDGSHFALSPNPTPDCLNPWDTQQSRVFTEEGLSPTLAGADGGGGRNPAGLVIQGTDAEKSSAETDKPKADTLRCAAFLGGASAQARSIGYSEKVAPTLKGEPCGFSAPCAVLNDQGGERFSVEKSELSPTLRSETHGNLPIVAMPDSTPDTPAVTMRLREGCDGGGKGPLLQNEKCGTLAAGNDQYLFAPQISEVYPISTQIATRHYALGEGTGFGIGEDGDPAYTLQSARGHAVGIHLSYEGDINTSPRAYSLTTNGTATGRNGPLVAHTDDFGADENGPAIADDVPVEVDDELTGEKPNEPAEALGLTTKGNGECFLMPECHYTLTNGGGQPGQGYPAALVRKAFSLDGLNSNSMLSPNPISGCREVETARTLDTTNPCPSKNQGGIAVVHPEISGTLVASAAGLSRPGGMGSETDLCVAVKHPAFCLQGNMIGRQDHNGPRGSGVNEETAFTLTATDVAGVAAATPQNCQALCKCQHMNIEDSLGSSDSSYQELVGALCNGDHKGVGNQYVSQDKCIVTKYLVRRLTPTECERLQGYPDGWTAFGHDGKEISDTRRYQMLGNSVCVNVVAYIMQGIAEQFNKPTAEHSEEVINGEGVEAAE